MSFLREAPGTQLEHQREQMDGIFCHWEMGDTILCRPSVHLPRSLLSSGLFHTQKLVLDV